MTWVSSLSPSPKKATSPQVRTREPRCTREPRLEALEAQALRVLVPGGEALEGEIQGLG